MMTLVIPLFFVLAVLTAPPVSAGVLAGGGAYSHVAEAVLGGPAGAAPAVELGVAALGTCASSFCTGAVVGPQNEGTAQVACTGSVCGSVRPAPLRVADAVPGSAEAGRGATGLDPFAISPLDPEFCEYVGPAPFFMSPSDSEFCGLVSPAPLALPPAANK
ncbi:hypothetical protein OG203_13040 [Nocardia sp. NBC_01499]|uniref:hypothetical protein n=1 Tax=Nocardia sp. NBC_01499 TaxID=2903597 RepID=UPI003863CDF7